jgi:hypothetical protein
MTVQPGTVPIAGAKMQGALRTSSELLFWDRLCSKVSGNEANGA